jgi:hypothetical protein
VGDIGHKSHSRCGCVVAEVCYVIRTHPTSPSRHLGGRLSGVFAVFMLVMAILVPSPAGASASEESSYIARVNSTRASVGLAPLAADVQLTNLARGWAGAMRDGTCGAGNFICHASPISAGVTHPWAKLGENVGTGPDVGSIMTAFIGSPGHYANIVDPEFTHIGVGVVWDGNRMFTTHRFMKLQDAAPTTTTTAAPTTTTTAAVAPTTQSSTPTTAAPATTTPTNDGGSPDQETDPAITPGSPDSADGDAPLAIPLAVRQSQAALEERASVLIGALVTVD